MFKQAKKKKHHIKNVVPVLQSIIHRNIAGTIKNFSIKNISIPANAHGDNSVNQVFNTIIFKYVVWISKKLTAIIKNKWIFIFYKIKCYTLRQARPISLTSVRLFSFEKSSAIAPDTTLSLRCCFRKYKRKNAFFSPIL